MSRMPEDLAAYQGALTPQGTPDTAYLIARHWELTNTRYLLGPATFFDELNQQLDPEEHRFHIVQRFTITAKPGIENPTQYSELTAVPAESGDYALFEFAGALPRAKLYSEWQVSTGSHAQLQPWARVMQQQLPGELGDAIAGLDDIDLATLETLASTNFDPWNTVLVSTNLPTTPAADTNQYAIPIPARWNLKAMPRRISNSATHAGRPSVLLLNDKFDPHWRVFVDDKPIPCFVAISSCVAFT